MLAEKLKLLRKKENITQEEFAKILNVTKGAVAMWETDKRTPDVDMLKKIADYFNVSVDFLTNDTVNFDFYPHENDDSILICPICGYNYTHFQKIINVDFKNTKSYGIALEFFCEMDHIFYLVVESYKGNSYFIFTDGSTIIKTTGIPEYESNPQLLSELLNSEKYRSLDDYGKDMINTVLNKEYERCIQSADKSKLSDDGIIETPKGRYKVAHAAAFGGGTMDILIPADVSYDEINRLIDENKALQRRRKNEKVANELIKKIKNKE